MMRGRSRGLEFRGLESLGELQWWGRGGPISSGLVSRQLYEGIGNVRDAVRVSTEQVECSERRPVRKG